MLKDMRLALPAGNIFRYFQPEAMPKMPDGDNRAEINLRTAREIEQERLSRKKA